MKYALLAIGLVIAASAATYARYESLDPCDWLEHDLAQKSGLAWIAKKAEILAKIGLDPGPTDCLSAWWEFRADALSEGS